MAAESSTPASILGLLADLSQSAQKRSSGLTIPLDWFTWLPAAGVRLLAPPLMPAAGGQHRRPSHLPDRLAAFDLAVPLSSADPFASPLPRSVSIDRRAGERLAAIDRIRPEQQRSLRAGFLFVAGRRPLGDGRMQRVFLPLLSVPVRIVISPLMGPALVSAAGDVSVTERVEDPDHRHKLEAHYELGGGALDDVSSPEIPEKLLGRLNRLRQFAKEAAHASGFNTSELVPVTSGPDVLLQRDGLVIVAGVGLFTTSATGGLSASASLRAWAARELPDTTAFSALYLGSGSDRFEPHEDLVKHVLAPVPLTPIQRKVVAVSREATVSVVSGAAGTGKSHTVSAIACDAVARGETVLVAAKSDAAVDALLVLLGEAPNLEPVVFGSSERRDELADRLTSGALQPAGERELAEADRALSAAVATRDELFESIIELLQAEAHVQEGDTGLDRVRLVAPLCFDPACDLAEVGRLVRLAAPPKGWWARRKAERARRQAVLLAGASRNTDAAELAKAVDTARRARAAGDLKAAGGLDLTDRWARLEALEIRIHRLVGIRLALTSRSSARLNRSSLEAVAVLATALRSGRAARRDQLSRLDNRLTRALPLWVGTLGDIEDLLPPTPGLFDLVILDEASAIDQPLAAPALLRARRAIVVGDPHQLRHVSFLADEQLRNAAEDHGLNSDPVLVGRLDVRRNSIFDVAMGAAPATVLDEHFRSAPHLIEFVAKRLYGGRLIVATRTPRTERRDCIEVIRLTGRRDKAGVVGVEIDAVLKHLDEMLRRGVRSAGVVTPFRAQADALEAAVVGAFSMSDLEALDLRVGTVHAFQGNERDVVLVSMGIGEGDNAASWRFAEDPHLFAVLATRARQRLFLLLPSQPPAGGLLADYIAQADDPPLRPATAGVEDPWTASVAGWLSAVGIPAICSYPAGRHAVDVCAGDRHQFVGLECTVHRSGPAAHIERHLALRRAGWELADAFKSRWGERQGELLVELAAHVRPSPPGES